MLFGRVSSRKEKLLLFRLGSSGIFWLIFEKIFSIVDCIMQPFFALTSYFILLLGIGFFSSRRQLTSSDFLIGNRSLNYWLTALAAHASDMSSWLFMGYPATVFLRGSFSAWTALGLIFCMFLNWQLVAKKIRILSYRKFR